MKNMEAVMFPSSLLLPCSLLASTAQESFLFSKNENETDLHGGSAHVLLCPPGGAVSSVVYEGRVFSQSYFSWPLLLGSLKSARDLQNHQSWLSSAGRERTAATANQIEFWLQMYQPR